MYGAKPISSSYQVKRKVNEALEAIEGYKAALSTATALSDAKQKNLLLLGVDDEFLGLLESLYTSARSLAGKIRKPEKSPKISLIFSCRREDYSYYLERYPSKKHPEGIYRWCRVKKFDLTQARKRLGVDSPELRAKYGLDNIPNLPIFPQAVFQAFQNASTQRQSSATSTIGFEPPSPDQ